MRVGLEIGIDEVRNLARLAVQLDQVGPFDLAEVGPGASLVDAEQRVERLQRGAMDVEGIRQQFADGRPPAGFVDDFGTPGLEVIRFMIFDVSNQNLFRRSSSPIFRVSL